MHLVPEELNDTTHLFVKTCKKLCCHLGLRSWRQKGSAHEKPALTICHKDPGTQWQTYDIPRLYFILYIRSVTRIAGWACWCFRLTHTRAAIFHFPQPTQLMSTYIFHVQICTPHINQAKTMSNVYWRRNMPPDPATEHFLTEESMDFHFAKTKLAILVPFQKPGRGGLEDKQDLLHGSSSLYLLRFPGPCPG